MIDWSQVNLEDFEFRIEGEGIEESGNHIIFPVRIYYQDGATSFFKSVPIRSEFYNTLKKTPDWKKTLVKIFRERVRDELARKIREETVTIDEKIEFINNGKQAV